MDVDNDDVAETVVGKPHPVPDCNIVVGQMRKALVTTDRNNNSNPTCEKVVLQTQRNQFFELGRLLRQAIYGQVNHAVMLQLDARGVLARSEPKAQVAIKVYGKQRLQNMAGKSQENPIQEINIMQLLGVHPNVVTPIEVCQDRDHIYLITEFCDGGELYDIVEEMQQIPEALARDYFRQILYGLSHLQSLNIIHRDMSLENVLVTNSRRHCKIIDFGMSMLVPRHELTGQFMKIEPQGSCGKKNYMSPEVLDNRAPFVPAFSDIWAVGVMLFIMLTGCPPVDCASPSDGRFVMICRGGLGTLLEQWGLRVPPDAVDLMRGILRPRPEDRLTIDQMLNHPWMLRTS